MNFKMSTRSLKRLSRLTLVVDGPKDFIEKVETAIHSILAFPEPPPVKAKVVEQFAGLPPERTRRLPGPLLPVTDNDEATITPAELATAKENIIPGGRFEPIAPGEVEKLKTLS